MSTVISDQLLVNEVLIEKDLVDNLKSTIALVEKLEAKLKEEWNEGYNECLKEAKAGVHHKDGIYSLEQVEQFQKGIKAQAIDDLEPMLLAALKAISGVPRLPTEAVAFHRILMEKLKQVSQ